MPQHYLMVLRSIVMMVFGWACWYAANLLIFTVGRLTVKTPHCSGCGVLSSLRLLIRYPSVDSDRHCDRFWCAGLCLGADQAGLSDVGSDDQDE